MFDREINGITVLKRVVAKTEGTESDDKALFLLFFGRIQSDGAALLEESMLKVSDEHESVQNVNQDGITGKGAPSQGNSRSCGLMDPPVLRLR